MPDNRLSHDNREQKKQTQGVDSTQRVELLQKQIVNQREGIVMALVKRHEKLLNNDMASNPALQKLNAAQSATLREEVKAFGNSQQAFVEQREERIERVLGLLHKVTSGLEEWQRTTLTSTPADRIQAVADFHQRQQRDLQASIAQVNDAIIRLRALDEIQIRASLKDVSAKASTQGAGQILDELEQQKQQQSKAEEACWDTFVLASYVARTAWELRRELAPDVLQVARRSLGVLAEQLSDDAIQRIHGEGAKAAHTPEVAEQRIKGQLFEELVSSKSMITTQVEVEQKRLQEQGIRAKIEFIAGDRLRDSRNNKLSDGVFAWRDTAERLHITRFLEAKAGEYSATKLHGLVDKMTKKFMIETAKYANDLVKDEIKQGKLRSADAKVREAEILKELLADEVQEEKGQLTRTQERLTTDEDHDTKVYIDGKAELLARTSAARRRPQPYRRMCSLVGRTPSVRTSQLVFSKLRPERWQSYWLKKNVSVVRIRKLCVYKLFGLAKPPKQASPNCVLQLLSNHWQIENRNH